MRKPLMYSAISVAALQFGCATAPVPPSAEMSPINSYMAMDCADVRNELAAVQSWEQYYQTEKSYHESDATLSNVLMGVGAVIGALAAYAGDDASLNEVSTLNEDTAKSGDASQISAENSAKVQAVMAERRSTLEQMLAIKQCT